MAQESGFQEPPVNEDTNDIPTNTEDPSFLENLITEFLDNLDSVHDPQTGIMEDGEATTQDRPQVIRADGVGLYADYDHIDLIQTAHASYIKELNKFNTIYEGAQGE
jgi:hypothetical protein